MDKPDRVEAGQWWVTSPGSDPYCFTQDDVSASGEVWWRWVLGDDDAIYLGSCENPEPSEWMIETLAEHVNAIVDRAAEPTGHARTLARHIVGGGHTRWNDIREGVLLERAVLSLYSILRKLGKW